MTVQAQDSVQYYDGPINVGTVISITDFTFIDNSHISMKLRNVDGIWKYGVDYTVDGAGTLKRTATILKEVKAGQTLAVYLDVPITQNISPEEGGNFPASTNEFVLDKLTYICQMLYERVARSMQVSIDNPFNGTLSVLAPSKAIKINAAGDGLELSEYDPDTALETTKEYMESAQTAASNALTSQIAANSSKTAATQQANLATQQANIATEQATIATEQANIATQQATIATNKASEVVASGNTALSNIDTAKNNAITSITNQETTSKNVLIDEGATQIGRIQNEGAKQVANVQSTGFYMRDDKLYFINSQGEETEFKSGGSGLEICDIGMALYVDETKGLRRYLNGQIVDINTNTQAFLNRLQEIITLHPSLLCTEEEWQTAKTMSAFGQVGKFVFNYSGDKIVSVRLPRVVNVQGLFDLQNLGMTVGESLPTPSHTHTRGSMNISGSVDGFKCITDMSTHTNGALKLQGTSNGGVYSGSSGKTVATLTFKASDNWTGSTSQPNNLPSTYQDNAPVQQEAIQYPYFIQIATGAETENNIINDIELNNPYSLFDSKYSDHELNNLSWLKSKGQWNNKADYPSAYDELLREYNDSTSVEETEGSITFKRTPKGYKIALADQETAIDTKYSKNGIAWYYILDTTNEKFKLPRTKFGFEGIRTSVGDDIEAGLPNITGTMTSSGWKLGRPTLTGAFYKKDTGGDRPGYDTGEGSDWYFDASRSSSIYGNSTTVQPPATQMYLYFYVGETVQNANLIDAGRIGEQLATKTDILQASGAGMPSNKYIDLTLGASGTTYTAPANGWFIFSKRGTTAGQWMTADCGAQRQCYTSSSNGAEATIYMAVKKGDVLRLNYNLNGEKVFSRFVYAQGSESEAS